MQHNAQFTNLRDFNYYDFSTDFAHTLTEYIWIDSTGKNLLSKSRVYQQPIKTLDELEWWTSCDQTGGSNSEIWLKPVYMCKDPFRKGITAFLVICETFQVDKITPGRGNFRNYAKKIMEEAESEQPLFEIEQQYFICSRIGTTHLWPLGWPEGGFPYPQGRYYCSVGDLNSFGRAITEAHLRCCLTAGIKISGFNGEVAPGQWGYQLGISKGIECSDQMWISRYILLRLGEEMGAHIDFEPKPIKGNWNGSGAHVKFSTKQTRAEGGVDVILNNHLPKLREKHLEHIIVYGEDNKKRLLGTYETSSMHTFSSSEGNLGVSVRIPVQTANLKKGYYEDRRPASNIDPYLVTAMIVDTTVLDSKYCDELVNIYKILRKSLPDFAE